MIRVRLVRLLGMFLAAVVLAGLCGFAKAPADRDVLFQSSVLDALLAGVYDGEFTVGELKKHGDFGLGTFNAVDGEMIVVDGVVYQAKAGGKVLVAEDAAKTPWAAVTWFEADRIQKLGEVSGLADLGAKVDAALPTRNLFFAIRIDGRFKMVKTRSIRPQKRPYRPLAEVVKDQVVVLFEDLDGTLVGLRCPPFVKGSNVPGYHWHFISADRKQGGHVLDCRFTGLVAKIDLIDGYFLLLPGQEDYLRLDLSGDKAGELGRVEGNPAK
ncbi:MAG: acetolactate decarboxylase [Desulfovibrionaceae bacterium]|nr:acetolactate decarboxylase [Desulfovibrionaceae bacterium]